ncbi:MAG: flagellin [Armatimonadetes bacterium]|nr:flagellin [Armatimonadota bacterium]
MSLRINLNTAALTAHRTLSETDTTLSKTIERLSSGFKINSAGDDPAGLVISEKLRAQVSGIGQAIKNAGDAVNMVKTAEGALSEVSRLLRSMRDLAVHAANTGANDPAAVQADQAQITNSIQSLNKIAQETMFGGRKLLDGTAGIRTYIDGSAVMTGDFSYANNLTDGVAIKINITAAAEKATLSSAATYSALTSGLAATLATFADTTAVMGAWGTMLINGATVAYVTADTVATVLTAIEAVKTTTGVGATYNTTTGAIDLTSTTIGAAGTFDVITTAAGTLFAATSNYGTGTDWGAFATRNGSMYVNGVKVDYASGDSVQDLIIKINAKTDLTRAAATYNQVTGQIDVKTNEYGSIAKIGMTLASDFLGGISTANDYGANARAEVTKVINGIEQSVSDAIWQSGIGLELKDSLGNTIKMREAMGSVAMDYATQFNLGVNTLKFQVGAYDNQLRDVNIGSIFANELGRGALEDESLSTINVTDEKNNGAQKAIRIMDDAIQQISSQRAALGATQKNVLESSITSLNIAKENISASESTIRDTDMAAEVVNLTKNQILQQSGVSMLAQANQMPQTLLRLLQ